jgi:molecular chaperone DnaK
MNDEETAMLEHLVRAARAAGITADGMAITRLGEAAKKATAELRSASRTTVNLPYLGANETGPLHLQVEVGREHLQAGGGTPGRPRLDPGVKLE